MGKFFYSKLAFTNLKHNKSAYVPYMLASIGIVFTYFLFMLIGHNDGMKNIPDHATLGTIFGLGEIVVTIFAAIFILYANSFLIKRRKKEFGLYGILGLEKRHVSYVMFYETIFMAIITIGIGLVFGLVFGKLIFLAFMNLLNIAGNSTFEISSYAVIKTILLFFMINFITLVFNYIGVHLANPIVLLKGEQQGEKEPKTPILMTIIGVISLIIGYYMALTVKSSIAAFQQFFIAVLFVIFGTYALFTAGSITILKRLKKNKKFYYKPDNFISVSGMIYRMKQNAAGLASICILSTMVLVIASTTIALYVGQEDILHERNPYDVQVDSKLSDNVTAEKIEQVIKESAIKNHIKLTDDINFKFNNAYGIFKNNEFLYADLSKFSYEVLENEAYDFNFIAVKEYNRITNQSIELKSNEVIYLNGKKNYQYDILKVGNINLTIKEKSIFKRLKVSKSSLSKAVFIVINDKDLARVDKEMKRIEGNNYEFEEQYCSNYNIEGESNSRTAFNKEVDNRLNHLSGTINYQSLDLNRDSNFSIYGGLLFIGAFLGLLFLLATVLIIYFKQVSEGFDDRNRFLILRKVGMDLKAIKKTINSQIIMVFFLPLLGAIIHIGFAFKMICSMLGLFYLTNTTLFLICTLASIGIFSVIYSIVYSLTAKVYYKIIKEE